MIVKLIKKPIEIYPRVLIRFLFPYIIILFIPLIFGSVAYKKTLDIVKDNASVSNIALLKQCKIMLDSRLMEIRRIVEQLACNSKITRFQFVKEPYDETNIGLILDIRKDLYNYRINNNFIFNYYLLFKQSGQAIAINSVYPLGMFYDAVFKYKDLSYKEWYKEIFGKYHYENYLPAQDVIYKGKEYSMVTCIHSLGSYNNSNGAIVMLIDSSKIIKMLNGLNIAKGGWAYITDKSGNIICGVSSAKDKNITKIDAVLLGSEDTIQKKINSESMFITYTTSQYNGWKYVLVQPIYTVMNKVNYIKTLTWAIMLISLLIGIIFAFLLARRNTKPINTLISTIKTGFNDENYSTGDAYEFLQGSVSRLVNDHKAMQTAIKEQIPFLKVAFFEKLLKGQFHTNKEIDTLSRHIGIRLKARYYVVAVLHFRGYNGALTGNILDELDKKKVIVKNMIETTLSDKVFLHDIDQDKIALLMLAGENNPETCKPYYETLLKPIRNELHKNFNMNVLFMLGSIYENLLDVPRSYVEAWQTMNVVIWKSMHDVAWGIENVAWGTEIVKENKNYYYPAEIESRLMSSAKAGDKEEVFKLLKEVYTENFIRRQLSANMLNILMYEMLGSIVKILDQTLFDTELSGDIRKIIDNNDGIQSAEWFNQLINGAYSGICDNINERKKSHNVRLIEDIIDFIKSSYMKPELSQTLVAEKFRLSPVYLSQFFKEQTGENFSSYLQNIRIEQGKKLLSETDLRINEIAVKVGYYSSNTFCRVFRRINDQSATDYKRLKGKA